MFKESAEFYDKIYKWKNYELEAEKVKSLIKKHSPEAKTILDIGCGTHEHVKYLKQIFSVDGLDINSDFLSLAREKNPEGNYTQGDMKTFSLDKKYDVVMSLFSSIGYMKSLEDLNSAFLCMAEHTEKGGTVIIEPWFTPDERTKRNTFMQTVDESNFKVCRMGVSETRDRMTYIEFHYLVGTASKGVRYFTEIHELSLFTQEEMLKSMESAGLKPSFEKEGFNDRGVYIGKR